jgi:hypothetical protein
MISEVVMVGPFMLEWNIVPLSCVWASAIIPNPVPGPVFDFGQVRQHALFKKLNRGSLKR